MGSKSILCLWILVLNGVFGVGTAEMEGPSVTLHTAIQEYNQIKWIFGHQNWIIASCNIRDTQPCEIRLRTEEQINTFGGRLQIDDNGSLTIQNISAEHAGLYTLQIFNTSNKKDKKKFIVSISFHKTVNDSKCSKCVRQCSVENVPRVTLSWNISSTFLEVKYQDTSNSCVVDNSITDQTKQDCECMSPSSDSESGLDPWLIGVLVLVLVLVGVAVVAVIFFYKKCKAGRNVPEAQEPVVSCNGLNLSLWKTQSVLIVMRRTEQSPASTATQMRGDLPGLMNNL